MFFQSALVGIDQEYSALPKTFRQDLHLEFPGDSKSKVLLFLRENSKAKRLVVYQTLALAARFLERGHRQRLHSGE